MRLKWIFREADGEGVVAVRRNADGSFSVWQRGTHVLDAWTSSLRGQRGRDPREFLRKNGFVSGSAVTSFRRLCR